MPVTYIEDLSLLTAENLSHFDVFVNSGSVDLITPEQEKAVYDFVQNGGSFLGACIMPLPVRAGRVLGRSLSAVAS